MKNLIQLWTLSLVLLISCETAESLSAQSVQQDEIAQKQLAAEFSELAEKYICEPRQFQFKSQENLFAHLQRPWQTYAKKVSGEFLINDQFAIREIEKSSASSVEKTTLYTDETIYECDGDKRAAEVTYADWLAFMRQSCRHTPAVLLRHVVNALKNGDSSIRFAKEENCMVVSGSHGNEDFRIQFSADETIQTVNWLGTHEMWGDQLIEFQYGLHKTAGKLHYPSAIKATTFDILISQVEILSAEKSDSLSKVQIPSDHLLTVKEPIAKKVEVDKYSDQITFLHVTHADSRTAVVEFKDFLLVIDAPKSSGNGKLILDKIDELKFGKPVKYFAFGHHHPHYLGGVRSFVARGATVLTTKKIEPYIKKIVGLQYSREPDELENLPQELTLRTFEDHTTITDGEYEVQIYDIGMKSKHTIDYLLFYFPKEKMVFQGDGVWLRRGTPIRERTQAIYDAIVDLKLDVVDSIQGWPTKNYNVETKVKFADLKKAVENGSTEKPENEPTKMNGKQVFDQLKSLVGTWKDRTPNKNVLVEYRLISRDSVLVERWSFDNKREALTLYHLDGEKLMATHYCPSANQPRLLLNSTTDSKFVFKFDSATNLPDRGVNHCIEFWLKQNDDKTLTRSETYRDKDGVDVSEAVYGRVEIKED